MVDILTIQTNTSCGRVAFFHPPITLCSPMSGFPIRLVYNWKSYAIRMQRMKWKFLLFHLNKANVFIIIVLKDLLPSAHTMSVWCRVRGEGWNRWETFQKCNQDASCNLNFCGMLKNVRSDGQVRYPLASTVTITYNQMAVDAFAMFELFIPSVFACLPLSCLTRIRLTIHSFK